MRTPPGSFTVFGSIDGRTTRAVCVDGRLRIDSRVAMRLCLDRAPSMAGRYAELAPVLDASIIGTVIRVIRAMDSVASVVYAPPRCRPIDLQLWDADEARG